MRSHRVLAALVVIVGVLALGAAAAGIDQQTGSGPASDAGDGEGDGVGQVGDGPDPGSERESPDARVPAWVVEAAFFLAIGVFTTVGLLLAAYVVWRDGLEGLLAILVQAKDAVLGVLLYFLIMAILVWGAVGSWEWDPREQPDPPDPGGGSGGGETAREVGTSLPLVATVAVVVLLAVVGVLVYRRYRDAGESASTSPEDRIDEDESDDGVTSVPAPPATAGIPDAEADNAVYRAWRDLAERTSLARERTHTHREIADAAIAQGLDRESVATLADVFAEVRYGGQPITDARERRARSALQRIEGEGGGA